MNKLLTIVLFAAFLLGGCAGRVHLADDTGRHVRQVFTAQADSRPTHAPAHLSADDAKMALSNHRATFGAPRSAKSKVRKAGGGIRLEAK